MTETSAWPPAPIKTDRLVLRESEAGDREAFVELFSSPEVGTYIGGSKSRDEVDRTTPPIPGHRHGVFVVALDGAMIGMVSFDVLDGQRTLGYLFLPSAWGKGFAYEACAAALDWYAAAHPDEPLVSMTQTANTASMRLLAKLGFTEGERYQAYGAEQCHWRQ
ncbi:GNAT family N-acetyltransferase [Lentzea sp. NBRC 102530]|uniref:GNAT family N-acetyltransferase n=1 Tax=Lentzea sp. NBRC 102530 TaxID=3032201 RepID=UPI0024A30217|nr:GNAT family N-acetyltransferase [Lentzea sp. NBRC 102530]GLY48790.1 N-acetyltransferase [Lentzea sp. NBRC 102530]